MVTKTAALLTLWLISQSIVATDYYVRNDGSDSNPGTSNTAGGAWLTHAHAAANSAAGDRIFVTSGGKFTEQWTETSDGTSTNAANCVQWIWTATTTLQGSITSSGNFARFYGNGLLTVTNNNDQGMTILSGTLSNWVSGIRFVDIEDEGVWLQGTTHGTVLHDVFIDNPSASQWPEYGGGTQNACLFMSAGGTTNVLLQYITMDRCPDYMEIAGQWNRIRHIVAGPNTGTTTADHVDVVQMSNTSVDTLIEYILHYGNRTADNHLLHMDDVGNHRNRWRYGMTTAKGGAQWFNADNHRFYNWTFFTNDWTTSTFQINGGTGTDDLVAVMNAFWYANPAAGGTIWAGAVTHTYNASFGQPAWVAETGDVTDDFLFTDVANTNLLLQSGSPLRGANGAGTAYTLVNGNQTATTINVDDAYWFYPGDVILLGADQRTVVNIPSATSIEVDSSVTVLDNEEVVLALNTAKDVGAYPFGAAYLVGCSHTASGNNYTATPTGDVEFVQFSENGIVASWDGTAPYTYTSSGGTVTVRAFAKWSQNPMAFDSTALVTATGVIAAGAPIFQGAPILK